MIQIVETAYSVTPLEPGEYLCTVAQKTAIAQTHLEGGPPPTAMIDNTSPTRFPIAVSVTEEGDYRLVELPYDGPDRDQSEWHTEMSVLHGEYRGDGERFRSTGEWEQGFFVIHRTLHSNADGDLGFHHAGFEWAGGEDHSLSSRWGRCRKR